VIDWRTGTALGPAFSRRSPGAAPSALLPALGPSLWKSDWIMNGSGEISGVDALRTIDLVWTLRDIKAKRTLLPVDPDHLQELVDRGLVEMRDGAPVLTNAGHQVLD
jgi:hypothetical protein